MREQSVQDCLFCTKQFCTFSELNHHLRCHTRERPFFCKVCPTELRHQRGLNKHADLHDPDRKLKAYCKICSKGFSDIASFLRHNRLFHSANVAKPFKCTHCAKEFSFKQNLDKHLRIHSKEKPFVCGICEKIFTQKSHLERHFHSHLNWETPFPCQVCSKGFKTKQEVKKHFNQVHMKENFKFGCKNCRKKFFSKSELTRHQFAHNEIPHTKYCCRFCGKAVGSKHSLTMHLRIHTGEKLFHCKICEKKFTHPSNLKRHAKQIHPWESL